MRRALFLLLCLTFTGSAGGQNSVVKLTDVTVCTGEVVARQHFKDLIEAVKDQVLTEFVFEGADGGEPPCHFEASVDETNLERLQTWADESMGVEVRLWRTTVAPIRFIVEAVSISDL